MIGILTHRDGGLKIGFLGPVAAPALPWTVKESGVVEGSLVSWSVSGWGLSDRRRQQLGGDMRALRICGGFSGPDFSVVLLLDSQRRPVAMWMDSAFQPVLLRQIADRPLGIVQAGGLEFREEDFVVPGARHFLFGRELVELVGRDLRSAGTLSETDLARVQQMLKQEDADGVSGGMALAPDGVLLLRSGRAVRPNGAGEGWNPQPLFEVLEGVFRQNGLRDALPPGPLSRSLTLIPAGCTRTHLHLLIMPTDRSLRDGRVFPALVSVGVDSRLNLRLQAGIFLHPFSRLVPEGLHGLSPRRIRIFPLAMGGFGLVMELGDGGSAGARVLVVLVPGALFGPGGQDTPVTAALPNDDQPLLMVSRAALSSHGVYLPVEIPVPGSKGSFWGLCRIPVGTGDGRPRVSRLEYHRITFHGTPVRGIPHICLADSWDVLEGVISIRYSGMEYSIPVEPLAKGVVIWTPRPVRMV